jgi:hypothetical protein
MRHLGRFCTIVPPLLALVSLLAGPAAAAPPREDKDSAASSPRLKYLPNDYWLAAECDVATVMKFLTNEGAQNPQFAQFQQYMQLVKQFTGIDPETDVNWVSVFAAGKLDAPKGLVVVQGSFKNDAVAKRLAVSLRDSIVEDSYKKQTIYTVPGATLYFPEASTLVLGDEALVKDSIDQLADGKRKLPESLKSVLGKTSSKSILWAAVQLPVILEQKDALPDWLTADADLFKALKKIDCVSVTFDVSDDGLTIKSLGYAGAPGEAKNVYAFLSERKKNLLYNEGSNVLFTTLLILSQIKMNDTFIECNFRLTGDALKQLWDTRVIVRPGTEGSGSKEK